MLIVTVAVRSVVVGGDEHFWLEFSLELLKAYSQVYFSFNPGIMVIMRNYVRLVGIFFH